MNYKIRNIVLDWDGTVCNSGPESFRASCSVFERLNITPPTMIQFFTDVCPRFEPYYRKYGVPADISMETIYEWYYAAANHHNNELFWDAIPGLSMMRENKCRIALVTSQSEEIVNHLLDSHKIRHLFDAVVPGARPTKVPFLKTACQLLGSAPCDTYAVGDMVMDMTAAVEAGLVPVGIVRNGNRFAEILYKAGAARVITDLRHLLIP